MRKTDLATKVRQPGFTPAVRDVPALFELLASNDDDLVRDVERALVRIGPTLVPRAREALREAARPLRGRLCRVLGKLVEEPDALACLLEALGDADGKTRRNAALALGRAQARHDDVERVLLAMWHRQGTSVEDRRAIAQSLGKIGGAESIAALRTFDTEDAELRRIAFRARMQLERDRTREEASAIDEAKAPDAPRVISFYCREGIERILERELRTFSPSIPATLPGRVDAVLAGPLASVWSARTWTRIAFPLSMRATARSPEELARAVTVALTSDEALAIFRTWTRGAIRYRIEFPGRGPSRALVWRIAKDVSARAPDLVNDPTQSTWEALIHEDALHHLRVELEPRALVDPRFTYRTGDVPAASHPTLAAALARVAGARPNDVVWDPFVGSGTELVERAKLGPYARLVGSDLDPNALAVARANLTAAGLDATLTLADATKHAPEGVTLILTNPPMGRRVARGELAELIDRFIAHVVRILPAGGRLVWLSPQPERTRARFAEAQTVQTRTTKMAVSYLQSVDMGGFTAELQSIAKV